MKRYPFIVGVMGGAGVGQQVIEAAQDLGRRIAEQGWVLLNGGRNAGVMAASAKGAREQGGLTIGILPDETPDNASAHIQIPICTGMGSARNMINILSSHVVVACAGGTGTVSEIALALKHGKTVLTLNHDTGSLFSAYRLKGKLFCLQTPEQVILKIKALMDTNQIQIR